MADELPDPERFGEAQEAVISCYMLVQTYLDRLPLPIVLPEMDDDWTPVIGLPAVHRARVELIDEQPIDRMAVMVYRQLLLDWLAAFDLAGFIHLAGPAPWRLDGLEMTIARVIAATDVLDQLLGEDPSEE
jgi:hypothetical protein